MVVARWLIESVVWHQTACSSRGRGTRLDFFEIYFYYFSLCAGVFSLHGSMCTCVQVPWAWVTVSYKPPDMDARNGTQVHWRAASDISSAPRSLISTRKLRWTLQCPSGMWFNQSTFSFLTSPTGELRKSAAWKVWRGKGMTEGDFGISFWRVFQDKSIQTRCSLPGRVS